MRASCTRNIIIPKCDTGEKGLRLSPPQQLWQLGEVRRHPPGLVAGEHLAAALRSGWSPNRLGERHGCIEKNPGQSTHPRSAEFSRLGFCAERQGGVGGTGLAALPGLMENSRVRLTSDTSCTFVYAGDLKG